MKHTWNKKDNLKNEKNCLNHYIILYIIYYIKKFDYYDYG